MKQWTRITLLIGLAYSYVACSPVKFTLDSAACDSRAQRCIVTDGQYHFDNVLNATGGQVDILIVDDNSGSMSSLQKSLTSRFSGFIDQLDARGVDYRLAITTTDISSNVSDSVNNAPRAINQSGALQDGHLISMGGASYLTNSTANRKDLFNSTIVRPETIQCEQFIANWINQNGIGSINSANYSNQYIQNCPSGDNRNIFAANLTLKNNPNSFIRQNAALAIIILGDSDERDGMYVEAAAGMPLSSQDQPATLIQNFWDIYGKSKSLSVHAITVKDNTCLADRANQVLGTPPVEATRHLTHGSIGTAFLSLTNQGWGKAVDICQNDYTTQLGDIGTSILNQVNNMTLSCSNPSNLSVTITSSDSGITWTQNGSVINFNKMLPIGSSVRLVYDCQQLNN